MNRVIRMLLVLTVVGILSGLLLAGTSQIAQPLIEKNQKKALQKAIFEVLPEAKSYKMVKKDGLTFYRGFDSQGKSVGVASLAEGPGFQGKITLMIGINNELTKLKGLMVLESVETPGLGGKISEEKFQAQFMGVLVKPAIEYVKDKKPEKPNEVQAITGATISSRAVVETINKKVRKVLSTENK